ncbi:unnamed protein product, partial [Mesorhabditis belari]|uniref:Cytochrome P450 n=1 Tax=Mesorhabditis belari TaxID=2138241 RepID=A0AAF3FHU1_9BILA
MIFLLLFVSLLAFLFHELYWKRRNFPPGPTPLPFLGNLLEVQANEPGYEAYRKWQKQYGSVYTYWLGTKPIVSVNDYETIKETFIKDGDKYADRFHFKEITDMYRGGDYGVVETDGPLWRDQRRFTLHTLRDFGMGKNIMEERVMTEVDHLLERLEKQKGEIYIQKEFDISVGSIINNILFGYRFDEERVDEFLFVKSSITKQMKEFANPFMFLIILFPKLRYFPYFSTVFKRLFTYRNALFDFFEKQIEVKMKEVDLNEENSNDFVECFLKEKERKKGTPAESFYSDLQLQNLVFDLWVAGMETTSNTLTWGFCYILNHPNVQAKIHEELNRVIKSERKVLSSDRNELPYVNAVICEIQRLTNLLPQNLFHRTTEDVVINGFTVPKGTAILPQISCVLYDEKTFPDPYLFNPNRFLNSDGSLKKVEQLVPFSVGKRQCLGEGLARLELFLFISNVFQKFQVSSKIAPSMKKKFGTTVQAPEFFLIINNRFDA